MPITTDISPIPTFEMSIAIPRLSAPISGKQFIIISIVGILNTKSLDRLHTIESFVQPIPYIKPLTAELIPRATIPILS